MSDLGVTLVTGLALGVTYGLLGGAVSLVWTATRTLHLAIGPVLVVGVLVQLFLGVEVLLDLPDLVPLVAGMLVAAGLSAALQPLVLRPLREGVTWLIGLAVAGVVLETAATRVLGARTYRPEPLVGWFADVAVAGTVIDRAVVVALLFGVPLVAGLVWVDRRTRLGRALRLVGGSPPAAELLGIDPRRVRALTLGLAGAAVALGGALIAPIGAVGLTQSSAFTLRALAAAAVFGVVGPGRAVLGGVVLGLVEAAAQRAAPQLPGDLAIGLVVLIALAWLGDPSRRAWGRAW